MYQDIGDKMNLIEIRNKLKDCRKEIVSGHMSFSREPKTINVKTKKENFVCARIIIYSFAITLISVDKYKVFEVEYKDIIDIQ